MSSTTTTVTKTPAKPRTLVDMNWDPITRIVGSLGIYTKIDFANREVAERFGQRGSIRSGIGFGKAASDAHCLFDRTQSSKSIRTGRYCSAFPASGSS